MTKVPFNQVEVAKYLRDKVVESERMMHGDNTDFDIHQAIRDTLLSVYRDLFGEEL